MYLTDACTAALDQIIADHAPKGYVAYVVTGRADGVLIADRHDPLGAGHADVIINYAGDTYDLYAFGEHVSGQLHTLRRVLLTRLCRHAAKNPANA